MFASNVLNVQADETMLRDTLSQILGSVKRGGRVVFNYPASPRYLNMRPIEVKAVIEAMTSHIPTTVGGTPTTPVWELRV